MTFYNQLCPSVALDCPRPCSAISIESIEAAGEGVFAYRQGAPVKHKLFSIDQIQIEHIVYNLPAGGDGIGGTTPIIF